MILNKQQMILFYAIIVVISIFLIIGIIKFFIKKIYWNKKIDLRAATLSDKWFREAFLNYSRKIVASQYNKNGKNIKTKKGEYRADYMNDVNIYFSQLKQECFIENWLSEDFCCYAETYFSRIIRRKELNRLISAYRNYKNEIIASNYKQFQESTNAITPSEFFEIRSMQSGDFVGAYIIFNQTKQKYYVGQAKRLYFRINQHFTGHGNGDVYADYKYGDQFYIKIISLADSGYHDLDLLEKDLIYQYQANITGYNKTKGNN